MVDLQDLAKEFSTVIVAATDVQGRLFGRRVPVIRTAARACMELTVRPVTAQQAVAAYLQNMTAGKILLMAHPTEV